jgi:hypothetical protein
VQRLLEEPLPHHVGVARPPRRELQVGPTAGHERGTERVVGVLEVEPHPRVFLAEIGNHVRHEPGSQGELKGDPNRAGFGIDQFLRCGKAVVEGMQDRIDVAFEDTPGIGCPQDPARAQQ